MKLLGAAEADFRGRDAHVITDFWTTNVADLYGVVPLVQSFRLRWERRDEREPDVRGEETLTLTLPAFSGGQVFTLPSSEIGVDYTMATPSKGQGARAVELRGLVKVVVWDVDAPRVWLDLKARMARIDAPGVEFDEAVRGLFALTK